jgi:hypothetical protein
MRVRFRDAAVTTLVVATLSLAAVRPAAAQGYFSSDNLGLKTSVTCYTSLAAALSHSVFNCGTSSTLQRDFAMYFVDGNLTFGQGDPVQALFLTNWYSNLGNNPSNTNVGFVQMYDDDGGSVTSMSTGWDDSRTIFTLAASGGNTIAGCGSIPPQDCGRLWNGSTSANGGSFITWNVNAVFSGFTEATFNSATQVFESASEPVGVSGTVSGIFQDYTTGLYYQLSGELNSNSWAVDHGFGTNTVAGAAITATPEPASMALLATGLLGLGGFSLRRRRKQTAAV